MSKLRTWTGEGSSDVYIEGAAMGAAAVEASSSQRNSRKPRLEVEMSQLLFELSGDRALALRIFNNEAAAFKVGDTDLFFIPLFNSRHWGC